MGPPGNAAGLGALVEVRAEGRTWLRQVQGLRGFGQGPSRVHVGLGTATEVEVSVWWPDGETTSGSAGVRRVVTARHPAAP
ncbi:MAG: ASPIC/UnbV domain-containing protein [Deltaproteobacteria bacterium]|nr:ASPIC/UnbV domain-containing protein [Deltaproteobacteria bacterium]